MELHDLQYYIRPEHLTPNFLIRFLSMKKVLLFANFSFLDAVYTSYL